MLIKTHREDGKFFLMNKQSIEDCQLSWKAKGILSYLMSKPSDWQIHVSDLAKHSTDGESAVRSALAELEVTGYLVRRREHGEDGQFQWICMVYETPVPESARSHPDDRKLSPSSGFPQMDNPQMENHYPTKNDLTKNDDTKNENTVGDSKNESPTSPTQDTLPLSVSDKDTVDAILEEDLLLFEAINQNRKTNRQRASRQRFDTIQQKAKWREATMAAKRLYNGHHNEMLKEWVNLALEKGITSKGNIVAYVAKCAANQVEKAETPIRLYES